VSRTAEIRDHATSGPAANGHDGQMDEGDARPGLPVQVNRVQPGTAGFGLVLALAARVLAQDRYLTWISRTRWNLMCSALIEDVARAHFHAILDICTHGSAAWPYLHIKIYAFRQPPRTVLGETAEPALENDHAQLRSYMHIDHSNGSTR
jgi:hypothetical protein